MSGTSKRKSPSGSKRGRNNVECINQNKISNYFQSPRSTRKQEELGTPPPSKKRKPFEDDPPSTPGNRIITVNSESDQDSLLDAPMSPIRKIKRKTAKQKKAEEDQFFPEITDVNLNREPSTPSRPSRNALVNLNIDKQKKPVSLCRDDVSTDVNSNLLKSNKTATILEDDEPILPPRPKKSLAGYVIPKLGKGTTTSSSSSPSKPSTSTNRREDSPNSGLLSKKRKQLYNPNNTPELLVPLHNSKSSSSSLLASSTPIEEDGRASAEVSLPKKGRFDPVVVMNRLNLDPAFKAMDVGEKGINVFGIISCIVKSCSSNPLFN